MNFDEALQAHADWKMKLSIYLKKPDGSLNARELEADDHCTLGQWIKTEALSHSHTPAYANLKTVHAKFHKVAADVIRKAESGQKIAEDVLLGVNSEYTKASIAVAGAVREIKKSLGK